MTGTREQHDVAVELAATVLAIQQCVSKSLADQPPDIGRVEEQAREAFEAVPPSALDVSDLVALRPDGALVGDDRELGDEWGRQLAARLNTEAAKGLAFAMDLQLARGVHPDVAWQRAVAGYGLTGRAMRRYISVASRPNQAGASPMLSVTRERARRTLLDEADKLGRQETEAWSTLPAGTVAKAYDPKEPRDRKGRWTAGAPETKVKTADAVDELLEQKPERFTGERWRFATDTDDRWRFANTEEKRWPDADPRWRSEERWQEDKKPQRRNQVTRIYLFANKQPNESPRKEPVVVEGDVEPGQFFIPMADLPQDALNHAVYGEMDFAYIRNYMRLQHGRANPVEVKWQRSGWEASVGLSVHPDVWADALHLAVPLWHQVYDNPMKAVDQLGPSELSTIAERAGYSVAGRQAIVDQIQQNVDMQEAGIKWMRNADGVDIRFDPGLLEALADYVVWSNPGILGSKKALELADLQEENDDLTELASAEVPGVLAFQGLTEDENGADVRGKYAIDDVTYTSAISAFGAGAPLGKIALRELDLKPKGPSDFD